jgi:hypothetical protein
VVSVSKNLGDPPNCEKCGQPTTLLSYIPGLGSDPGYRIFDCKPCHVLQWVVEEIAGSGA